MDRRILLQYIIPNLSLGYITTDTRRESGGHLKDMMILFLIDHYRMEHLLGRGDDVTE